MSFEELTSRSLSAEQLGELELLMCGAYAPLKGYLSQQACANVLDKHCLADCSDFWPYPLVLTVDEAFARSLQPGERIALRDGEGIALAMLTLAECWPVADLPALTDYLSTEQHTLWCLSGKVDGVSQPVHYDFERYRLLSTSDSPYNNQKTLVWLTDLVLYKPQLAVIQRLVEEGPYDRVVIQTSSTSDGEHRPTYATRLRCYEHGLATLSCSNTLMLLPTYHTLDDFRQLLLSVVTAHNCGARYVALDPYSFNDAQHFQAVQNRLGTYAEQMGVEWVATKWMDHSDDGIEAYTPQQLKHDLQHERDVPSWFSDKKTLKLLKYDWAPMWQHGVTIFFTGLSGAGKSTIANALKVRLEAFGGRQVTLLDGDIVRHHLSSELTFSKAHRDLNILRIGFVASEITKHRGIAICAPIAPYRKTRRQVRKMIRRYGEFVEVYVSTDLSVCEARDCKGLYAKARAGKIKGFTGIDDPYEVPKHPEVEIDTAHVDQQQAVEQVVQFLLDKHYLKEAVV